MTDIAEARKFAAEWIAAWNGHDIEAVLDHYAETLAFTSPLVIERLGRADGTIRSKAELRAYFSQSLGPDPKLHFELLDVLAGVSGVTLIYRNHRDQVVAETMVLGGGGRAVQVFVHRRSA